MVSRLIRAALMRYSVCLLFAKAARIKYKTKLTERRRRARRSGASWKRRRPTAAHPFYVQIPQKYHLRDPCDCSLALLLFTSLSSILLSYLYPILIPISLFLRYNSRVVRYSTNLLTFYDFEIATGISLYGYAFLSCFGQCVRVMSSICEDGGARVRVKLVQIGALAADYKNTDSGRVFYRCTRVFLALLVYLCRWSS